MKHDSKKTRGYSRVYPSQTPKRVIVSNSAQTRQPGTNSSTRQYSRVLGRDSVGLAWSRSGILQIHRRFHPPSVFPFIIHVCSSEHHSLMICAQCNSSLAIRRSLTCLAVCRCGWLGWVQWAPAFFSLLRCCFLNIVFMPRVFHLIEIALLTL